ncbi:hypothetical protein ANO14919_059140 [Xylariales sp. No.14919]|nr:hypothetical protein ANO14919_059140 [Xylariales sp. No.14919]
MASSKQELENGFKDVDEILKQIDDAMQQQDVHQTGTLNNLIVKLLSTGNCTRNVRYLDKAITKIQEIIRYIDSHEVVVKLLNNLSSALLMRYERTGDVEDLESAISSVIKAIEATPDSDPDLTSRVSNLVKMQLQKYQRTGNTDYLEEAISNARQALEKTPIGRPGRVFLLANLSTALSQRYEQTCDEETLDDAISLAEEANNFTTEHKPDVGSDSSSNVRDTKQSEGAGRLSNLGSLLYMRYQRRHNISDLDDAISKMKEADDLMAQNHPDFKSFLNNFGAILFSKYEKTRDAGDLLEAISKAREAVRATPDSHPDLSGRLSNLSNMLFKQYEVAPNQAPSKQAYLEEAVSEGRKAVRLTPDSHPDLADRLNNLSNMLFKQYRETSNEKHLREAISEARRAVHTALEPQRDPETAFKSRDSITRESFKRVFSRVWNTIHLENSAAFAVQLSSFSSMLLELYEKTGELKHLDEAISVARSVIRATPYRHPDMARRLDHLMKMLLERYEKLDDIKDRDEAGTLAIERANLGDNC